MNKISPCASFKKVLLVDDDKVDIFISEKIMKSALFAKETVSFSSGTKALDYLKSLSGEPDQLPELIFLDISMPEMDGFDFMEEFKLLNPLVKARCIIILLANDDPESPRIKALCNSPFIKKILTKPLTVEALKAL